MRRYDRAMMAFLLAFLLIAGAAPAAVTLSFVEPVGDDDTVDSEFEVQFTLSGDSSGNTYGIELYATTVAGVTTGGVNFAGGSGLSAGGSTWAATMDTTGFDNGLYYVYGVVSFRDSVVETAAAPGAIKVYHGSSGGTDPTLTFTNPGTSDVYSDGSEAFTITWTDSWSTTDPSYGEIDLYAIDADGHSQTVATGLDLDTDGHGDEYAWDLSYILDGTYQFVAEVWIDGTDEPDYEFYSMSALIVDRDGSSSGGTDGPVLTFVSPGADGLSVEAGMTYVIAWDDVWSTGDALVTMTLSAHHADGDHVLATGLSGTADGMSDTYTWDTTGYPEGFYYFSMTITTSDGASTTIDSEYGLTLGEGGSSMDMLWETRYLLMAKPPFDGASIPLVGGSYTLSWLDKFTDGDGAVLNVWARSRTGAWTRLAAGLSGDADDESDMFTIQSRDLSAGFYHFVMEMELRDGSVHYEFSPGGLWVGPEFEMPTGPGGNVQPSLAWPAAGFAGGILAIDEGVTLFWEDEDPDDGALISLYATAHPGMYDTGETPDGVRLAGGILEDRDGTDDTFYLDTSGMAEGFFYIVAVIDDGVNDPVKEYLPLEIQVKRGADDDDGGGTSAVSVAITSPKPSATGAVMSSSRFVDIMGTASSDAGIDFVYWERGDGVWGYAFGTANWSVPGLELEPDKNIITVTAVDDNGDEASASITVYFDEDAVVEDESPPAITITSPDDGASFETASVMVRGNASDADGISHVEWWNERTSSAGNARGTTSWYAFVTLAPGENTIIVTAFDSFGNATEANVTVTGPGEDTGATTLFGVPPLENFEAKGRDGQVGLFWSRPAGLAGVLVVRSSSPFFTAKPEDGKTYAIGGSLGGATVIYAGKAGEFADTGLTNGTTYFYAAAGYTADLDYGPIDRADAMPLAGMNAPTMTASATPTAGPAPLAVSFTGSATASTGKIVLYEWDFDGDGRVDFGSSSSAAATYLYRYAGVYEATLLATGSSGAVGHKTVEVVVRSGDESGSVASSVAVTAKPAGGPAPLQVVFGAEFSDTSASPIYFEWDFDGDGNPELASPFSQTARHTYYTPGAKKVRLKVMYADGTGERATVMVEVSGADGEPGEGSGLIASPSSGAAPLNVSLTAGEESAFLYQWDFDGDGIIDRVTASRTASATYGEAGTYSPRVLVVTRSDGMRELSVPVVVTGGEDAPVIESVTASPTEVTAPGTVAFSATASSSAGIAEYRWDFDGDGVLDLITTDGSASTIYLKPGTYQPRVRVVDASGVRSSGSPGQVIVRTPTTLKAAIVQPADGDVVSGTRVSCTCVAMPAHKADTAAIQWRVKGDATWKVLKENVSWGLLGYTATGDATSLAPGSEVELRGQVTGKDGTTVTTDMVTVTIGDSTSAGITDILTSLGLLQRKQQVDPSKTNLLTLGSEAQLSIPAGAVSAKGTITMTEWKGFDTGGARVRMRPGEGVSGVSLDAEDTTIEGSASLSLSYPDTDGDGIVDGTDIAVADLDAYYADPTTGEWMPVPVEAVDTSTGTVVITAGGVGEYVLGTSLTEIADDTTDDGTDDDTDTTTDGTLTVNLTTDKTSYRIGQTQRLSVGVGGSATVDAYLAIFLPDGSYAVFLADFSVTADFVPMAANLPLATFPDTQLLTLNLVAGFPTGDYLWYMVFAKPGTDLFDTTQWLADDGAEFSVAP